MKFQRIYILTVGIDDVGTTVTIASPITLHFDVQRTTLSSANTGRFQVLNLKEETRKKIFHDRYDTATFRHVVLQAGYVGQNPLPVIYQGNIVSAYSYRRRADWVTEIEAFDGGKAILTSQVDQTLPAGTTLQDMMTTLMKTMSGNQVTPGAVGAFSGQGTRGVTLVGNSWDILTRTAQDQGGAAFIDQEKVHVLRKTEYLKGVAGIPLLSSSTGLLKAQRRFKGRVDVELMFESRLSVGQLVELQSAERFNNGQYRVEGVRHSGTISAAVDGGVVTTANLWDGLSALTGVQV